MSEPRWAALMADAAQADYFRTFLDHERSQLDTLRAKDVKQLTECMTDRRDALCGRRAAPDPHD